VVEHGFDDGVLHIYSFFLGDPWRPSWLKVYSAGPSINQKPHGDAPGAFDMNI
jgi:hypothetical protein